MTHRLSAAPALDSLSNLAASLNAGKDKAAGDAFFIAELARDQIESMYRGDWLARKIVDIVPYDCVREWREWHGDPAHVSRIEATESRLGLQRAVQRAMVLGRLYGGGALIVGTRETDPAALARELIPEAVGPNGIAFLHAVSRWQLGVTETERDPLSPWFGEPKAYEVTAPARGAIALHPSRVIRFLGSPLPDPGLFGANLWSDSVLTALYDAIHAVALTTTGATSLMHEAKVDVVTVPNLSEHLSNAATTAQLSSRFAYAATMKSINNLLLLGDGETWAREKIDFGGLPEMVRTFLQVAAGAADIPVTRLLGQSPAGLSATGDSDTRNYYDMIAARQEIDLRPQLERLDRVLLASAGVAPGALRFEFRPLWQMDAAAKAAVALQKAQATQIYAGLNLWPAEVMAGLVAGQLAEDGTYPNAEAVLSSEGQGATGSSAGPTATLDFDPDQPRDPQGRWANGGSEATQETSWTEMVGRALKALNPIGQARAGEIDPEEEIEKEGTGGPPPETREPAHQLLRPELGPHAPGTAKPVGGSPIAGGAFNLPRSAPAAGVKAEVPTPAGQPKTPPVTVPKAGSSARTRARVPPGDFGSIKRVDDVVINVSGDTRQELGKSYEQGIRDTFESGKSGETYLPQIGRWADDVYEQRVLESKHTDVYLESIYNPRSLEEWQHLAIDKVVKQARELTNAYEGGAIYFTNDEDFASDYSDIFEKNGITKFRFVIVKSSREAKP